MKENRWNSKRGKEGRGKGRGEKLNNTWITWKLLLLWWWNSHIVSKQLNNNDPFFQLSITFLLLLKMEYDFLRIINRSTLNGQHLVHNFFVMVTHDMFHRNHKLATKHPGLLFNRFKPRLHCNILGRARLNFKKSALFTLWKSSVTCPKIPAIVRKV